MTAILPDFQKFLTDRKLVPSNRIPFYTLWVNKFLSFSNNHQDKTLNLRIEMFLDSLEKGKKLSERR